MKRNYLYALFLLPALLIAGCENPMDDHGPEAGGPTTFTATIDDSEPATKTLLGAATTTSRDVLWKAGDVVKIGDGEYTAESLSNDGKTAVLTGSGATKDGDVYKAYYPASIYSKTGNTVTLTLPAKQNYNDPTAADNYRVVASHLPMYAQAQSGSTNLNFKNLCAVLNFQLKGTEMVTKVVVTSATKKLNGSFTPAADGTAYKAQMSDSTPTTEEKKVELDCTGGGGVQLNATTPTEFCIAIPPADYPQNDLTVEVYGTGSTTTPITTFKNSASASQLKRSEIYDIEKEASSTRYILEHTGTTVTLSDGTVVQELIRTESSSGGTDLGTFDSYSLAFGSTNKVAVAISSSYEYAAADADGNPERNGGGAINWISTKPSGLSSVSLSSGTTVSRSIEASVSANSSPVVKRVISESVYHAAGLKRNGTNGFSSSSPQDLSLYDITNLGSPRTSGKPTAANCYVVDRAGWYMFPVVYGNAIDYTRSVTGVNAFAYTDGSGLANAANLWHDFQNYNGGLIKTPYILDDVSLTMNDVEAVVVWEDVESAEYAFLTDVSLVGVNSSNVFYDPVTSAYKSTVPYIKFQIPQTTLYTEGGSVTTDPSNAVTIKGARQGNALIALRKKSGGTILWSWHIWVTDGYDTDGDLMGDGLDPIDVVPHASASPRSASSVLPVNLGWCDTGGRTLYEDRVWFVRIHQEGRPEADGIIFKVVQQTPELRSFGSNTYYQWGRKDPFLPSDGSTAQVAGKNKAVYSPAGYTGLVSSDDSKVAYSGSPTANASASIQNPYVLYRSSGNNPWWMSGAYPYNLWNMGHGTSSYVAEMDVYKTVYDPCPPGYTLPHYQAFTGFTATGSSGYLNNGDVIYAEDRNGDNAITVADILLERGWYFKTGVGNNTIFFPLSGLRLTSNVGVVAEVNTSLLCWSAMVGGPNTRLYFGSYLNSVVTTGNSTGVDAYSVRAVREISPGDSTTDPYTVNNTTGIF